MAIHALVVDDDPVTRGLVAEQLISLQVSTVRTVESGRAALDVLRQHPHHPAGDGDTIRSCGNI